MSEQAKQLAQLKQQILEQISEEELEAAVGAHKDYYTVNPDNLPRQMNTGIRGNFPPVNANTGVRYPNMNTGARYVGPLK